MVLSVPIVHKEVCHTVRGSIIELLVILNCACVVDGEELRQIRLGGGGGGGGGFDNVAGKGNTQKRFSL